MIYLQDTIMMEVQYQLLVVKFVIMVGIWQSVNLDHIQMLQINKQARHLSHLMLILVVQEKVRLNYYVMVYFRTIFKLK